MFSLETIRIEKLAWGITVSCWSLDMSTIVKTWRNVFFNTSKIIKAIHNRHWKASPGFLYFINHAINSINDELGEKIVTQTSFSLLCFFSKGYQINFLDYCDDKISLQFIYLLCKATERSLVVLYRLSSNTMRDYNTVYTSNFFFKPKNSIFFSSSL